MQTFHDLKTRNMWQFCLMGLASAFILLFSNLAMAQAASMSLVKSSDAVGEIHVGQTITYTFVLTNTGTVPLTLVTIDDNFIFNGNNGPISSLSCDQTLPIASLPVGGVVTCTATYTVNQADINQHVDLSNTASASSVETTTTSNPVNLPVPGPSLSLSKSANAGLLLFAGQLITYTFTATAGPVDLTGVDINDNSPPAFFSGTGPLPALSCTIAGGPVTLPTDLAAGATLTCTTTYTVTAADIAAGGLRNFGVASSNQTSDETSNTVIIPGFPTLAKSFAPAVMNIGGTSTLTITLKFFGGGTLTKDFHDTLPAGLTFVSGSESTTCGGVPPTLSLDLRTITLPTGDTIPASGSCTITATVTGTTPGTFQNTIPSTELQVNELPTIFGASALLLVVRPCPVTPPPGP